MKTKNITTPMWTKQYLYKSIKIRLSGFGLQPGMAAQWEEYEAEVTQRLEKGGNLFVKRYHLQLCRRQK